MKFLKFFKKNYSKCFKYIKESKKYIYTVILIFILFALIGIIFPVPEIILQKITEFIANLIEKTKDMNFYEMLYFIFSNNIRIAFLSILFGIFFGIFPIISSITNGYILGFVSLMTIKQAGILELWRLLPHGLFELSAIFLSFGIGLRLGMFLFNNKSLKQELKESLRVFIFIILPLIIIAAIIETTLIFL